MTENQPEKRPRLKKALGWYGHVSDVFTPKRIGLLLGAAVLAVTGVLGGWSAVGETVEAPVAEAREPFESAPFEITVNRARVFDELGWLFPATDGRRYISVSVDVENSSELPVSAYVLAQAATLRVDGLATMELASGPHIMEPQVVRTSDSLTQRTFQPGLPLNVVLVWEQDASDPPPDEVTVEFAQHSWRRSVLDDSFGWRDPEPAVTVTLLLEELEEVQ